MYFDEIIGNDHIKSYFKKALESRTLSNSMLFSGIEGIGKFLFAKALAKYLMYPINTSNSTLNKIDNGNHPDLYIYRPESQSSFHSFSMIKELIEKVNLAPFEASAKVFIIEEAHRMQAVSANALLKTLEEPNFDSYIILITDKDEEIFTTLVSRCFKLKFLPLSDEELLLILQRWGKTYSEARRIALLSQGSLSRASEISNFVEDDEKIQILIDILSKNKIKSYVDLSQQLDALQIIFDKMEDDRVSCHNYKAMELLFSHIYMWYRDLFLFKNNISTHLLFYEDRLNLIEKQDLSNLPSLDKLNLYLSEAQGALSRNIKLKHCLENLFLKLNLV